jgi:methionyl-tRNA formyltransferase
VLDDSLLKIADLESLETVREKKLSDPELISSFQNIQPEIIFCIGGTRIIPKEILDTPKLGCINIHPALLPKYRGRFSTAHAIFNGESQTGVTLHWMDEGIDTGPIISQIPIDIEPNDTAKTLWEKFIVEGEVLFKEFLELWLSGKEIPSKAQDESQSTYYPKGLPNEGEIDWSWSGKKIRNFIRAMTFEPYPPAQFTIGKKNMVVVDKKYFNSQE